jgi:hypothetical protein
MPTANEFALAMPITGHFKIPILIESFPGDLVMLTAACISAWPCNLLHDLEVKDKTVQAILRHSNVAVRQQAHIKTLPQQSVDAMKLVKVAGRQNRECAVSVQ